MSAPTTGSSRRENLLAVLIALAAAVLVVGGVALFGSSDDTERVSASGDGASTAATDLVADSQSDGGHDESDGTHDESDGAHDETDGAHDETASAHDETASAHDETASHAHDESDVAHDETASAHDETASHPHDEESTPNDNSSPTTHGSHSHDEPAPPSGNNASTPPPSNHSHDEPATPTDDATSPPHDHGPHDGPVAQLGDLPVDVQNQVKFMAAWAMQYPTAADAAAHGFPKLTRFFPGIAAHYINLGRLFDRTPFDWTKPEVLLYDGDGPDARLVGYNYIVYSGANPPDGFPGDFDEWHEHPSLCLKNGIVIGEQPRDECEAIGGNLLDFSGFWLLHVWAIPGWEAPEGIFAHENSRV